MCGGPFKNGTPWSFFLLYLSTLCLQQFVNYSLNFSIPVLILTKTFVTGLILLSCDSLYPLICLFNFWGSNLPCDLSSQMNPRRAADFQFAQPLSLLCDGSNGLQVKHMPDWQPEVTFALIIIT